MTEFQIKMITKPILRRSMILKRYGHISLYLNGLVYAIGGFAHKDLANEAPVTLSAAERFSVNAERQWVHIS